VATSKHPVRRILAIRSFPEAMNDLRQFLSQGIIKVVWDGRMDSIELFAALRVRLDKVLDLQVVEVISRKTVRGETDRRRTERLAQGRFGFRIVRENRESFRDLHLVVGMQKCLEEQERVAREVQSKKDLHGSEHSVPLATAHAAPGSPDMHQCPRSHRISKRQ